jgi:hypothetical protein
MLCFRYILILVMKGHGVVFPFRSRGTIFASSSQSFVAKPVWLSLAGSRHVARLIEKAITVDQGRSRCWIRPAGILLCSLRSFVAIFRIGFLIVNCRNAACQTNSDDCHPGASRQIKPDQGWRMFFSRHSGQGHHRRSRAIKADQGGFRVLARQKAEVVSIFCHPKLGFEALFGI